MSTGLFEFVLHPSVCYDICTDVLLSSRARSFDLLDRADISLLALKVVISNGPEYNHAKGEKSPIEVSNLAE
jgi:hypothetical protein